MSIFSSIARVRPPRFIHAFEDAVEADARKIAATVNVDAAGCVGYAELLGFRYPVKAYHFKVSETLTRGSRLDAQGLAPVPRRPAGRARRRVSAPELTRGKDCRPAQTTAAAGDDFA